ncbi:glycosyltransferase [Acuticoccus yangtzensis]|uniref:glycosyltransferase n=1 Tax=Acuticoccus yangtzensis TaxID=1443441 RepID=UPI000949543A|nr:glycosyltransferase [Acuticoccus yangtzensis]
MATVALYPALTRADEAEDLIARLAVMLHPVIGAVERVTLVADFGPLQLAAMAPPPALAASAEARAALGDRLTAFPAEGTGEAAWTRLLGAADTVVVWRAPTAANGPFASRDALAAVLPATAVLVTADPATDPQDVAAFAALAARLAGGSDDGGTALATLAQRATGATAHIVGGGASTAQLAQFDLADGDVIACATLAASPDFLARMKPRLLVAAQSALHIGPTAAAAALREAMVRALAAHDCPLAVPVADVPLHRAALGPEHRDRVLAVPADPAAGPLGVMLAAARPGHTALTVSGFDGAALSAPLGVALAAAHPAAAAAGPGAADAALEATAAAIEAEGATITPLTASDWPVLRRRGAALPLPPRGGPGGHHTHDAQQDPADGPLTVLLIAPDVTDAAGEPYAAACRLGEALAARGARLSVAASQHMTDAGAPFAVDAVLSAATRSLVTAAARDPEARPVLVRRAMGEITRAVDRAAAAAPGPLLAVMQDGSLDHLAILAAIARDRPFMRVAVNLAALRAAAVWQPGFGADHADAVAALAAPGVHATVPTARQAEALAARFDVSLPVAPLASPLFGDADIGSAAAASRAARPADAAPRLLLPARGAAEGAGHAPAIAESLAVLFAGETPTLVFTADPAAGMRAADAAALKARLGSYEIIPPDLSPQDRAAALNGVDAVILTHPAAEFGDVPQRIAVDALLAGVPLVAFRGTAAAAFVAAHRSGSVVADQDPVALAEAAAEWVRARRAGMVDLTASAARALGTHGWGAVADRLLALPGLPPEATWRASEAAQAAALQPAALPLLADMPQPGAAPFDGRLLDLAAFATALGADGPILWSGPRHAFPSGAARPIAPRPSAAADDAAGDDAGEPPPSGGGSQGPDDAGGSGTLIVGDAFVFAALHGAALHGAEANDGWRIVDARPLGPAGHVTRLARETVAALDRAGKDTGAILLETFEEGMAPALWRALERAPGAIVALSLSAPAFAWPGRVAAHLSEEFERLGYRTLLVERTGRPLGGPARGAALTRVTLGPVWPPRPETPADIIALPRRIAPAPAALGAALRSALTAPVSLAGALPVIAPAADAAVEDAAEVAAAGSPGIAAPLPFSEAAALAAVRDPGTAGWRLASLIAAGPSDTGFQTFAEADAVDKRVHSAGVEVEAEAPMTVSVEVLPLTTRFVTLALAVPGSPPLAAAVIGLEDGAVVSLTRDSRVVRTAPQAGAEAAGEGGAMRLWLSLEDLEVVGRVEAQVVLREGASGSVHYIGTPQRRIGLRNLVVERRAVPSRLPPDGIMPAAPPAAGASSAAASPADALTADARATDPLTAEGSGTSPASASAAAGASRGNGVDLLVRGLGTDVAARWVASDEAEVEAGEAGAIVFRRNGCPYGEQLGTAVTIPEAGRYRLTLGFGHVDPQVHVAVAGKVVERVSEAGEVTVSFEAAAGPLLVELRVANSHVGAFTLTAAGIARA